MKVRKRRINSQDHTLGYLVGNKWVTRKQAIQLAKKGKIENVSVCGRGETQHLRGTNGLKLYGLATQSI